MECSFCDFASGAAWTALAWETPRLIVFADHLPIRPGHMQIIPRAHYQMFEDLPLDLAAEILHLGQRIARAQKRLHRVARVGFAFTGNEVAHVHAHVVPLHAADDITSARYGNGAERISAAEQKTAAAVLRKELAGAGGDA